MLERCPKCGAAFDLDDIDTCMRLGVMCLTCLDKERAAALSVMRQREIFDERGWVRHAE